MTFTIQRLTSEHAEAIARCVQGVYGEGYAHEVFYNLPRLIESLDEKSLMSVGALTESGDVVAHMAMTNRGASATPELGNTVVDNAARGEGLAWKVGAELTSWCRELGHGGFLHYPTTEHHIMQRQSVKQGFEIGLLLGYIPNSEGKRQAVTVVYEPLGEGDFQKLYVPEEERELLQEFAARCGLEREILAATDVEIKELAKVQIDQYEKRGLARLTIRGCGQDLGLKLREFAMLEAPCMHVDVTLDQPDAIHSIRLAREAGFVFAGWLPGFLGSDVLRLQKWDSSVTEEQPDLANPDAKRLLLQIQAEANTPYR